MQDLKAQLEIATTEKTKLLDLLSAEKAEKRALMPPDRRKTAEIPPLAAPARRMHDSSIQSQKRLAYFSPHLIHSKNQSWVALP